MKRGATVIQVLIAGPSDVKEFKTVVRDRVHHWSKLQGAPMQVMLVPVMWEEDSVPAMGASAQDTINQQLADESDALIALFGTRLGTATSTAVSGTAEEIDRFCSNRKPVAVLFYDGPGEIKQVDTDQLNRLRDYRKRCEAKGLLGAFESVAELGEQLDRILTKQAREILGNQEQSVTEPPPPIAPTAASGRVADVQIKEESEEAWTKLGRGELEEGMKALKTAYDKKPGDSSWPEREVLGLSYAFIVGGSSKALSILRARMEVTQDPSPKMKFYFGRTLEMTGEDDVALPYLRDAATGDGPTALLALGRLVQLELKRGNRAAAFEHVRQRIRSDAERRDKAGIVRILAQVLQESDEQSDNHEGLLLRELAYDIHPRDDEEQERLARLYVDRGDSLGLALLHYGELIQREPTPEAETNYGWSASKLGFPIEAVSSYRRGQAQDEPFAIANLALTLLESGFVPEARDLLDSARRKGVSHAQIDKATGAIVEQEENERERLADRLKLVRSIRDWRVREAQAMLESPLDAASLAGEYTADPEFAALTLWVGSAEYTGTFYFEPGRLASLRGRLTGRRMDFVWESVQPPITPVKAGEGLTLASLLSPYPPLPAVGFGVLLFSDAGAEGYFVKGNGVLDEATAPSMTEWRLKYDSQRSAATKRLSEQLVKAIASGRVRRTKPPETEAKSPPSSDSPA